MEFNVQDLTYDTFRDSIPDHGIVFIEFTAAWCGPCQWFVPVFARAADDHPEVAFARVDVEEEELLAKSFNVTSIPTVAVISDRVVLFQHPGALPADALEDVVQQAKALAVA